MRRKEDRTTQILALLVQEKKIEVTEPGPDHQRARLCSPVQHG